MPPSLRASSRAARAAALLVLLPLAGCGAPERQLPGDPNDAPPQRPVPRPPAVPPVTNARQEPVEPVEPVEPDVLRFVGEEYPDARVTVRLRIPREGVVLFDAQFPLGDFGDFGTQTGFRLGERIGWVPSGPEVTGPRVFRPRREDRFLLSPRFVRALYGAGGAGGAWTYPFGPFIAGHPDTPLETLAFLVEKDVHLHPVLIAHPRVRESLPLLMAMRHSGRLYQEQWRRAALPAFRRAVRDPASPREVLAAAVELLGWGGPLPEEGGAVVDHPRAVGDAELLLRLARLEGDAYRPVRVRAIDRLLALRQPPRALWLELPWWETHPQLVRDARVRRDAQLVQRAAWAADPYRFPEIRAETHRLLLADPATDAETVFEVAAELAANLRRCRRYPYPAREHGLAALAHPAARADERIAQALVYTYEAPEVRAAAYRRLTGRELPAESRGRPAGYSDDALLRQAHTLAITEMFRNDGWRDTVEAALRRMEGVPEAEEWRRILAENPGPESLGRVVGSGDARMARLRRRSPLLALLPESQRNDLGVGCDPAA